jgi:hypothetical protein
MKSLVLGLAVSLLIYSCSADLPSSPDTTAPSFGMMGRPKITLCHRTEGSNDFIRITVADAAVAAHLAHGDGAIGDPVPNLPGMVFDDNCVPTPAIKILFDNGTSSGPQGNLGNTAGVQELFEDFTISQNALITTIKWQQHDHDRATYLNTEVVIFPGLPFDDPPVFSSTIIANRMPNATGTIFGDWDGFDYEISGLSIDLPPGTYWLGLNANFEGIRSGWDGTTGGPDTIPGSRIVNSNFPAPGLVSGHNLAFTISGQLQ